MPDADSRHRVSGSSGETEKGRKETCTGTGKEYRERKGEVNMPYADHTYYTQSYHGQRITDETLFLIYAERASEYMDMVTFDRLAGGVPEEAAEKVQKCCCAVADALADYADYGSSTAGGSGKTAETIGKYSVSYTTAAQTISGLLNGASSGLLDYLRSICIRYLGGTGLMYRGCDDVCE